MKANAKARWVSPPGFFSLENVDDLIGYSHAVLSARTVRCERFQNPTLSIKKTEFGTVCDRGLNLE